MEPREKPQPRITTALLLAAGTGSRLQPLTAAVPKCLTEVAGIPMVARLAESLRNHGFRRLVVVLGHLGDCVRDFLGESLSGLSIEYVFNPRYRSTNNILSLSLAREVLDEPFLLIECDLVLASTVLGELTSPDTIAVSPLASGMLGTRVAIDPSGHVVAFRVGSDGADAPAEFQYKTVNIYGLSLPTWRRVQQRLDRRIAAGRVHDYYETVFAEMTADGSLNLRAVVLDPADWYEIDTVTDLRAAERLPMLERGNIDPRRLHGARGRLRAS